MVTRHLGPKIPEKQFSSRDRWTEKATTGVSAVSERKGGNGDCAQWNGKGQRSRKQACSFKHDPAKRAKETGKEQQVRLLHLTEGRLTKEVHKMEPIHQDNKTSGLPSTSIGHVRGRTDW